MPKSCISWQKAPKLQKGLNCKVLLAPQLAIVNYCSIKTPFFVFLKMLEKSRYYVWLGHQWYRTWIEWYHHHLLAVMVSNLMLPISCLFLDLSSGQDPDDNDCHMADWDLPQPAGTAQGARGRLIKEIRTCARKPKEIPRTAKNQGEHYFEYF